jgi:phage baseplate assembly protein W
MALKRADFLTGTKRQPDFFSDFLNNFNMTPYGNDIGRVTNEKSVNQSLKNLIKTNLEERLFQPNIGGNVYASLFELIGQEDLRTIEIIIEKTIENNEPRALLQKVKAEINEADEVEVIISITYNLINSPEPITLDLLLKRVR